MAFKTVGAHYEIVRRRGLGAQQCADCGWVYVDPNIPKTCDNSECPSNQKKLDGDRDDWRTRTKYGPKGSDY